MSQRKERKEATRLRVVAAARSLFEELGYLETPVRAIAQRAGVSVGGLFTTFEGKAGILAHIVAEHRTALIDKIVEALPQIQGSVEDRLGKVIAMAHAADFPNLRTMTAYIGCSYGWSQALEQQYQDLHARLSNAFRVILADGVKAGEIAKDTDLDLLLDMITGVHLRNYRIAWFNGLSCEELDQKVGKQLRLLLNGARP